MTIFVAPGLLRYASELSLRGRVRRSTPILGAAEAAYVGLPPTRIADGPLIVAALGAEPPERSLQFHLSLLGLQDGLVVPPPPSTAEAAVVKPLLSKLDTKRLTGLWGEGLDHALVLDGFWDLGTTPLPEALGRFQEVLPEGEMESTLRRYIDDSVNMLSELELNVRRIDEGVAPLNVLWPWGQGSPRRLPHLGLRRGSVLTVESPSLRMRGMARLVGYRSGAPGQIVVLEGFEDLDEEKAAWTAREIARRLPAEPAPFLLASDGLIFERGGDVPFREEILEDRSVASVDLWEAIDSALTPQNL